MAQGPRGREGWESGARANEATRPGAGEAGRSEAERMRPGAVVRPEGQGQGSVGQRGARLNPMAGVCR